MGKGKLLNIFKRKLPCKHTWRVTERSNVLQQDDMGYPLRLVIIKCSKCEASDQIWIDVHEDALKELETGESVLLNWSN